MWNERKKTYVDFDAVEAEHGRLWLLGRDVAVEFVNPSVPFDLQEITKK